jgi:hypothetical protein
MKAHRTKRARSPERDVCERLSQRLDEVARREGRFSNSEKIKLLLKTMFGYEEDAEIEQPSNAVLPESCPPATP